MNGFSDFIVDRFSETISNEQVVIIENLYDTLETIPNEEMSYAADVDEEYIDAFSRYACDEHYNDPALDDAVIDSLMDLIIFKDEKNLVELKDRFYLDGLLKLILYASVEYNNRNDIHDCHVIWRMQDIYRYNEFTGDNIDYTFIHKKLVMVRDLRNRYGVVIDHILENFNVIFNTVDIKIMGWTFYKKDVVKSDKVFCLGGVFRVTTHQVYMIACNLYSVDVIDLAVGAVLGLRKRYQVDTAKCIISKDYSIECSFWAEIQVGDKLFKFQIKRSELFSIQGIKYGVHMEVLRTFSVVNENYKKLVTTEYVYDFNYSEFEVKDIMVFNSFVSVDYKDMPIDTSSFVELPFGHPYRFVRHSKFKYVTYCGGLSSTYKYLKTCSYDNLLVLFESKIQPS